MNPMADVIRMLVDFLPVMILLLVGLFIYLLPKRKQKKRSVVETRFLPPHIPPYCIRCAAPLALDINFDFNNIVPHANEADIVWFISSKFSPHADTTLRPQLDNKILPDVTIAKFHVCGERIFQLDRQYRREDFLEFYFLHEKCYQAEEDTKATKSKKANRATDISGGVMGILLILAWLIFLVKWFVLDQLSILNTLFAVCFFPFFIIGIVIATILLVSKKAKFDSDFVLVKGWFRKNDFNKKLISSVNGISDILEDKLTYQFDNSDFATRFRESNAGILLSG